MKRITLIKIQAHEITHNPINMVYMGFMESIEIAMNTV